MQEQNVIVIGKQDFEAFIKWHCLRENSSML